MVKKWLLYLLCGVLLQAEDLEVLLDNYRTSSDLSNITKEEAAGFLDVVTRDDLEKMQAHNLMDVLKVISGLYIIRNANSLNAFQKPSRPTMPLSASRLYINDHDVSSTTFGSAFLIWGEMPIEFIDHIEVYKATSSVEFGNETAPLVIRVYTKDASRENGGKIKLSGDSLGSIGIDGYFAQEIDKDFSYFVYMQGDSIQREEYYNYYNSKRYTASNDKKEATFYANIDYKDWKIELANYFKKSDNFFGRGDHKTPTGGDVDSNHAYIHITKELPYDIKLQLSIDDIVYEREYQDENGIGIFNDGVFKEVDPLNITYHDHIYSAMIEQEILSGKNRLILGGFYKYKTSKADGYFVELGGGSSTEFGYRNGLHLTSIYLEENYNFDKDTTLVGTLKGDFYHYDKEVDSANHYVLRLGAIKNIQNFQLKIFYTDTYLPLGFYQVYTDHNTPYITNPHLKSPQLDIFSASVRYKNDHHEVKLIYAYNNIEDIIEYSTGFQPTNNNETQSYQRIEIQYHYTFDNHNRFNSSIFYGKNSLDKEYSPSLGANFQLFNKYKKFDIYNELLFRDSYTSAYGNDIGRSFDYTVAIKYNYSKDLHFGLRGENLFDDSYKVDYKNAYPVEVFDRKVWLEMGYIF